MLKLTLAEANAPRPTKPNCLNLRAWLYYYDDLACWKATQAERYLVGIESNRFGEQLSKETRKEESC
jgi:hypothetical protein